MLQHDRLDENFYAAKRFDKNSKKNEKPKFRKKLHLKINFDLVKQENWLSK